jgi:peptide/nickel transport system permease protein
MVATQKSILSANEKHVGQSQWAITWRQFQRHKLALAGAAVLCFLFAAAILADVISPYDPNMPNPRYAQGYPKPPTAEHWFGTDELGRDYFSRALSGARVSLSVGFVAVSISILIGILVGSLAGYFGGRIDDVITRIIDIFLSMPTFFLILTANAYLPPSIYNIMIVIGLFNWMAVARLIRAQFLALKEKEFVIAARAVGVPGFHLTTRHLLPNAFAPVIVAATLGIPGAILTESGLSFLGLGVQPPQASWGSMLENAQGWLTTAWWMWVPPGTLISITVLAFNFVGDGLRDALDPFLRQ